MKKIKVLIFLAGFLQIFSLALDQYVIQSEQSIRFNTNEISREKDIIAALSYANLSYGNLYNITTLDSDLKLKLENNLSNEELRNVLYKNKNTLLRSINRILENEYLQIENRQKYLTYFANIDDILKNERNLKLNQEQLTENFKYTGLILNDMYDLEQKTFYSINSKERVLEQKQRIKHLFLIIGMISSTASIFFILLIFYLLYRRKNVFKWT